MTFIDFQFLSFFNTVFPNLLNRTVPIMKKPSLILTLATCLSTGTALAANTITFQGEVTDQTCQVHINGQDNPVVLLPTVPTTELQAPGSKTGLTPFTLTLTDCSAPKDDAQLSVRFLARGVTEAGNLRNVATGQAAEHVSIQLTKDKSGTQPIDLKGGPVKVDGLVLPKGQTSASHTYAAQYYTGDGNATAGAVQAVVEYVISYQ